MPAAVSAINVVGWSFTYTQRNICVLLRQTILVLSYYASSRCFDRSRSCGEALLYQLLKLTRPAWVVLRRIWDVKDRLRISYPICSSLFVLRFIGSPVYT